MTFYSGFFRDAVEFLRKNIINTPIITGGPYPTASYSEILKDRNVNLCSIAEGEITLVNLLEEMLKNNNIFPDINTLKLIPSLAFSE